MAEDKHDRDDATKLSPASIDWDARYQESEALWSGQVNGSLVAEAEGMAPAHALDVGCGEGADAIWLAEQGWEVTAVDLSPTAVDRGRREAQRRNLDINWRAADVLTDAPSAEGFNLVSIHYPAFAVERRSDVVAMLTASVAPGGLLLMVGHAPPEDPDTIHFDPAEWVGVDDVVADLGAGWTVELHETRPRPGAHHHDSPHRHDVVVRVRRAS